MFKSAASLKQPN